jgi:DNA-binding Lrp family transcriptional regulator
VISSVREGPERSSSAEMDELDRKILQAYLIDGRLSYRELAHKLGVSTTTVQSRTSKLEKSGIIRGYSALLDNEKIGFQLTALTEVSVAKGKLLELEKEVAKMPQVLAVYDVTGLTDAMVIAKFKSREELSKFTKVLLAMPFVERTNTHIVLTTVKEDFRLI